MSQNNDLFTSMPVGKAVAKLAVPTVISQLIVILYSMADTYFIGQTGDPNQLAALSIAFPIFTLLTAVANLFGIGANSLIARSLGKNDELTAKRASSFCFWGSVVVTGILSVLLALFMKPILTFVGADAVTFGPTKDYLLYVFVFGGIPTVAGLVLGHLVRSIGKTKEAGIGLAIGGVLNIILDPIFIFVFKMDIAGAAIATGLSNLVSMIYFLIVLEKIKKDSVLTISIKHFSLEKKVSLGTLSVGFPAAISVMLVSFSISLLTGLLLRHEGGIILAAAYGVTAKCGTVALHISIGIAQGVMPLIGYSYGAKDHKRVRDVTKLSFRILWIFSIAFLIIVQLIPGAIVHIFTPDAQTIEIGEIFMRRWSWCVVGMCLFSMYNSIFQAVGKWITSLILAVLRLGVIFTILCLVLDFYWGSDGLMWVQAITDTSACLIAMFLFNHFKNSLARNNINEVEACRVEMGSKRIVAISREFGSGGRTIGKEVAEKLGISCYDSELIDQIARESGLAKEYIEKYGEETLMDNFYGNVIAGRDCDGQSVFDKVWVAQKKVIMDLAEKESCVIVGRCADYLLRDVADCVTVFIHASDQKRAERLVTVYGEKDEPSSKRLHNKDQKRKAYYELYTNTKWGLADNYELCLDSGKIGIEECANLICDLYKR